jgi:hypothetical protein
MTTEISTPTPTEPTKPISNVRPELVRITPALATEMLKKNTHNRKFRRRSLLDYSREIENGNWTQNGETIKFAEDGALLDGQHRLRALEIVGDAHPGDDSIFIDVWVMYNLPPETQHTMDQGVKRTAADSMRLMGMANANHVAAISKKVWQWKRGDVFFNGNSTPSTDDLLEVLKEHPGIHRSAEVGVYTRSRFRFVPASVVGTAHYLFNEVSPEDTVWFFARLADGEMMATNHPIMALRRAFMGTDTSRKVRLPDGKGVAYMIRAWNATREKRELTRIQQQDSDAMPKPR